MALSKKGYRCFDRKENRLPLLRLVTYRCFDPKENRLWFLRHVTFLEHIPFYIVPVSSSLDQKSFIAIGLIIPNLFPFPEAPSKPFFDFADISCNSKTSQTFTGISSLGED